MSSTNSLYIIPHQNLLNSLVVTLGLMKFLKKNFKKVGYFRPIIQDISDNNIELVLNTYNLNQTADQAYGYTIDQIKELISSNHTHTIYETLVEKYNQLQKEYDFVLIDGESWDTISHIVEFDINTQIAKNLNSEIILVLDNEEESHLVTTSQDNIFALFYNNKPTKQSDTLSFFLPLNKELEKITLYEVHNNLQSDIIFGSTKRLNHKINQIKIASSGVDNFLTQLNKGDLVIVSGDRSDIILSVLYSLASSKIAHISGIILTDGIKPSTIITDLLNGIKDIEIAILSTTKDSYTTAFNIMNIKPTIQYKDYTKLSLVDGLFSNYIDTNLLTQKLKLPKIEIMTPIMFEYNIFEKARITKRTIVLNESYDDRILRATEILLNSNVVNIILLGKKDTIYQRALTLGINIDKATIIDPHDKKLLDIFSKEYYKLRKHKGILLDQAYEIISANDIYFATMMVHLGYADGMVSGAVGTTANTVRPALQIIKTKKDIDIVSSLFFICFDTKVLVFADCAINPSPNAQQLAQIALSTALSAKQFGIEPKIAMLSYSTGDSGSGEDVKKVSDATKIIQEKDPNLIVDGPIQYDAAIDKETALKKLPNSSLKGDATILIFPDLNTGNNTYKAVQRSSGAVAIGPILQGLNKPINDLSRGCKVVDIINTVAITAIQI